MSNILSIVGLFVLGAIYHLVSYCYNLFILMCNLNFNVLEGLVSGLLDRLQALVMVFVAFKVGVALISYMLEPEKAMKDGSKLVTNILITAVLLISRDFVFGVFNDLSLLIMGNPTGYPLTTLSTVASVTGTEDEGLIMRFAFGKNEKQDIGDYLAISTVSIFVHDYNHPESSGVLKKGITENDGYNFLKMQSLAPKVNKDITYIPFIGTAVGLFLIYSLIKTAIEMGVRMFKLLILQLLAPVAIITCVGDGLKSSTFQNFVKKYFSTWAEAFVRMLTMLIIVVFSCKFFMNIDAFFANLTEARGITKGLITVLVVVAAFRFASDVPKFIDEILGTKMASAGGKGGFGHFVGGLLGAGIGAFGGAIVGAAGGGLGGAVAGAGKGLIGGIQSGTKGNNVAEFFKGQKGNLDASYQQGQSIAARGGLRNVMLGNVPVVSGAIRSGQDREIAKYQKAIDKIKDYDTGTAALIKQQNIKANAIKDANGNAINLASRGFATGLGAESVGDNKDEFKAKARQFHQGYVNAQSNLDRLMAVDTKGMSASDQAKYTAAIEKARIAVANQAKASDDAAGDLFEDARNQVVRETSLGRKLQIDANTALGRNANTSIDIKSDTNAQLGKINDIRAKNSYDVTHGRNPNNK